jgi:hypothetical protein
MVPTVFWDVTPCQLQTLFTGSGAGLRDYVCKGANWTAVGKAFSEKGCGIPEREFLIKKAYLKLSPRDTICEFLVIPTKRILQPSVGKYMVVYFVRVTAHKKNNRLLLLLFIYCNWVFTRWQ